LKIKQHASFGLSAYVCESDRGSERTTNKENSNHRMRGEENGNYGQENLSLRPGLKKWTEHVRAIKHRETQTTNRATPTTATSRNAIDAREAAIKTDCEGACISGRLAQCGANA
jgi:hypothetical protein